MGYLYAVERGSHLVKIGYSRNPDQRLTTMQTGEHQHLKLLGVLQGTRAEEVALHRRLIASQVRGEWYRRTPEVRGFLATLEPFTATEKQVTVGVVLTAVQHRYFKTVALRQGFGSLAAFVRYAAIRESQRLDAAARRSAARITAPVVDGHALSPEKSHGQARRKSSPPQRRR